MCRAPRMALLATGFTAVLTGCVKAPISAQSDHRILVRVDTAIGRRPISPYIYGVSFASAHQLADLNIPLDRIGGDSASTYNWEQDARGAGQDWFFESLPLDSPKAVDQYGDKAVALAKSSNASIALTVPMLGWVAKLGPRNVHSGKLAAFSIVKYGLQDATDKQGFPEAGDGLTLEHQPITNNDPNDASIPDSLDRERRWMQHNITKWGTAAHGGVGFVLLDNEPAQWHFVHRDVHPTGAHASEVAQKTIAFGNMVHSVDPSAKVVAPEEWVPRGWWDSGFDEQASDRGDTTTPRDRATETRGMDYMPWLFTQWRQAGHPVDIVSIHAYPLAGEYRSGTNDLSDSMQLLRNRSTRCLWDFNYREGPYGRAMIGVIPTLRKNVNTLYAPNTPIAITEYNWGGEGSMNGATAQADILGIFGREGVYMANRWIAPEEGSPIALAFKVFRNPDGKGNGFGDTSVKAQASADPDDLSVFAASRKSDGALTVVLINKRLHESAPVSLSLAHYAAAGNFETYRVDGGKLHAEATHIYSNGALSDTLPPQSITLLVAHGNGSQSRAR